MNIATHLIAPEDVMALLDGELSGAEAEAVSKHLDECDECAQLAGQLRRASQSLSKWTVPAVAENLLEPSSELAAKGATERKSTRPVSSARRGFWNWRMWATAGAGAAATVLILVVIGFTAAHERDRRPGAGSMAQMMPSPAPEAAAPPAGVAQDSNGLFHGRDDPASAGFSVDGAPSPDAVPAVPAMPMIARTAALTIVVKNFGASRADMDAILVRHGGYAAQLTVNTPANDARSFQASLRVPAPELAATLRELRALGRVETETQSGEEVTQQHADLVARLKNAQETEQRPRDLLTQRTGKIDEVLEVEQEIDRVRGEIEGMEAEQKALEHRINFATIDLQLNEEYREKLNTQSDSVTGRMRNALVAGLRHASGALLGIVLFFEEFGPVLLIWALILGLPTLALWRRYRKARAAIEGRSFKG